MVCRVFVMTDTQKELVTKAAELAKWLIETRGERATAAYIIAVNKYKLPSLTGREMVRKEYQKIKGIDPRQISLLPTI